jgi:hypothetical protein
MRLRCTARRTARSTPASAVSIAAFTVASRLSKTTLGSPLSTTFIRHVRSMPPRGPFTSCIRTLTRSIELANVSPACVECRPDREVRAHRPPSECVQELVGLPRQTRAWMPSAAVRQMAIVSRCQLCEDARARPHPHASGGQPGAARRSVDDWQSYAPFEARAGAWGGWIRGRAHRVRRSLLRSPPADLRRAQGGFR